MIRLLVILTSVVSATLFFAASASAHPLAPIAMSVDEDGEEVVVRVKRARVQPAGARVAPRFPPSCERSRAVTIAEHPDHVVETHRLRCGPLEGQRFSVDGLTESDLDAVVRVRLADGRELDGLLDRSEDVFVVSRPPTASESFRTFVRSGLMHLLGGWDHLLFVLGLVWLLRRARRVLVALTAFTAGHAVSMALTAFDLVKVPSALAEVGIAATLVWVAMAMLDDAEAEELRRPYAAALAVGVVHGLGFATAFADAGVTGAALPFALGGFHVGIELGQIGVVLTALLVMRLSRMTGDEAWAERLRRAAAYATGAVACMWLIERTLQLVGVLRLAA